LAYNSAYGYGYNEGDGRTRSVTPKAEPPTQIPLRAPGGVWCADNNNRFNGERINEVQGAAYVASIPDMDAYKLIAPPLAIPGQWVVYDNAPYRVTHIFYFTGYHNGYNADNWGYQIADADGKIIQAPDTVNGGYRVFWGHRLLPHPRPDHGGAVLSPEVALQAANTERQVLAVNRLAEAQAEASKLQSQQLKQETARLKQQEVELARLKQEAEAARLKQEAETARLKQEAETARLKQEAEAQQQAMKPQPQDVVLTASVEGAKNGFAASLFIFLADKFVDRYGQHLPDVLLTPTGRSVMPYLACIAVYLIPVLVQDFPSGDKLQAVALRGLSGTATLATSRLTLSIAPLMDSILQIGELSDGVTDGRTKYKSPSHSPLTVH